MHKIFIKILNYLSNQHKAKAIDAFNVQSYELKIQESLQNKLDRRFLMHFALIKNKNDKFYI